IGVAALQMTLAARCGIAGAPVHDAQVVDDEEATRPELELDAIRRVLEHPPEALIRRVVAADLVGRQPESLRRARVVVHRLYVAARVDRDHRRLGLELGLRVRVAEADRTAREQLEVLARKILRDAER